LAAAPLVRRLLRRAAGICVSTAALKEASPFVRPHADRTRVITFGIDPAPWCDVTPRGRGPFLFVGRLVPYKGLGVLLEALARVPGAELVVVGEGPLAEEIRRAGGRPGLAGRVRLVGACDRAELAGLMAEARAVVLPSLDRSETFGLVQLEAMASGVPVIVSDVETGIARVGEPGVTGLVVGPGDADDLARAIATFQDDPDLARAMGEAGRRRFARHYTRELMIEDLLRWYDEILGAEVTA
jgi:rhamnosyl/mannosyltransferase